ncbi:transposase [Flammeovirga pectinis]|nr:transposase [Flammeovirga pectinis]
MSEINKWQRSFLIDHFTTLLSFMGKNNYMNLARYSKYNEGSIRSWSQRTFDYLTFNILLIESLFKESRIIALDPSYISKSGKATPGVSYFWSGCAGAQKWGLEITGLASVGLESKTAMHLSAHQSIPDGKGFNLLSHCANLVVNNKEKYLKISDTVVVDGYFSKYTFVNPVTESGFKVVSKFAKNIYLRYKYTGKPTGKKGRPKTFDGRVKFQKLNMNHFQLVTAEENMKIYEAIVHSRSLKRWVKCVVVITVLDTGKERREILFSTDLTMEAEEVIESYRLRFQIEFLYRDAKQFVGLNYGQSRSEIKIHNHVNMSLTAVSIAKAIHYFNTDVMEKKTFSLSSIKTQYFNKMYLGKIITCFGINAETNINSEHITQLENFGCIAA